MPIKSIQNDFEINFYYEIDPESNMDVTIYKQGYILDYFVFNIDRFLSTRGRAASLVKFAEGKYRLVLKDGTILFFNDPNSCKVTSVHFHNGGKFHLTYNNKKQLTSCRCQWFL